MSKDYREPEELLSDESFLSWYLGSRQEDGRSWESWIREDPDRKVLVDQAVALLKAMQLQEPPLPAAQVQLAEKTLLQRIDEIDEKVVPMGQKEKSRRFDWRWMAAACILLLLVTGMVVTRMLPARQEQLAAGYGQILQRQLPDGSEVTMNANSRLRYFRNWQDGVDREVWIDGEAFFHVRKTPMKSRFIVHTDKFDIVVTGTQFNVMSRHDLDHVLLQEGSVIIHPPIGEDLHMVPGDFVQWDGTALKKTSVKVDSLTAWQEHQLVFDKTPLREVARIIEDQYGVKVTLEDHSIGDSTITGILPNNNLNVLLQALETTSDFDVIREDGTIKIKGSAR